MAIIEDVNELLSRINDTDLHARMVMGTETKSIKFECEPEIEINWAVANDWDGIPEEIGFWIIFTKDWVFDDTQKFYDVLYNTVRGKSEHSEMDKAGAHLQQRTPVGGQILHRGDHRGRAVE